MYLLDTNVYIAAAHDSVFAAQLAIIVANANRSFAVNSAVVAEVLIGLKDETKRDELVERLFNSVNAAFVVAPSHEDWVAAADTLRRLGGEALSQRRSFWNDLLIAASCARTGCTLITLNPGDFHRIARFISVEVMPI